MGKPRIPRNDLALDPTPAMDPPRASAIVTRAKGLALGLAWHNRADRRRGLGGRLGASAVVLLVRFPRIMVPDTDGGPRPSKTARGNTARPTRRLPVTEAISTA